MTGCGNQLRIIVTLHRSRTTQSIPVASCRTIHPRECVRDTNTMALIPRYKIVVARHMILTPWYQIVMTDDGTVFTRNGIFGAIDRTKVAVDLVVITSNYAMITADSVVVARDMEIGTGKGFAFGVSNIHSLTHLDVFCLFVVRK